MFLNVLEGGELIAVVKKWGQIVASIIWGYCHPPPPTETKTPTQRAITNMAQVASAPAHVAPKVRGFQDKDKPMEVRLSNIVAAKG